MAIALIISGSVGLLYWRLNDQIRRHAEDFLDRRLPNLQVHIRAARLVEGQGIEIRGLEFRLLEDVPVSPVDGVESDNREPTDSSATQVLFLDEVFLHCRTDLKSLIAGDVRIEKLTLRRPQLRLTRLANGSWDLEKLAWTSIGGDRPVVEIEGATIEFVDQTRVPSSRWTLRDGQLNIQPQPLRLQSEQNPVPGLKVSGKARGDHLRQATFSGYVLADFSHWSCRGHLSGVSLGPELLASLPLPQFDRPEGLPQLRAAAGGTFQVSYDPLKEQPLDFQIHAHLRHGTLDDERLGYPIRDLQLNAALTTQGIRVEKLSARYGEAELLFSGEAQGYSLQVPMTIRGQIDGLLLDQRIVQVLPSWLQRRWQEYSPDGRINLRFSTDFDGSHWEPDVFIECLDVSFACWQFPYRLRGTRGFIRLHQQQLTVDLLARAGTQPVRIAGRVLNPGPQAEAHLTIDAEQLALDSAVIEAMPPKAAKVVQSLNAAGVFDLHVSVDRLAGSGQPLEVRIQIPIRRASVNSNYFRYPVSYISGIIEGRGRHETGSTEQSSWSWKIGELVGRNDTGIVRCWGQLGTAEGGNPLRLNFTATGVEFEEELRNALPPTTQKLWGELQPQGTLDASAALIFQPAGTWDLSLAIRLRKVEILPRSFPTRIHDIFGEIRYSNNLISLKNIKGRHGQVSLMTEGDCRLRPDGGWHLRLWDCALQGLRVGQHQAGRDLMALLPASWRGNLDPLQLAGTFNVTGRLEIARDVPQQLSGRVPSAAYWQGRTARLTGETLAETGSSQPLGQQEAQYRAVWDLAMTCQQGQLGWPVSINNIYGGFHLAGGYDGQEVRLQATLDFDSLDYQQLQFTEVRGPVYADGKRLVFGSLEALRQPPDQVAPLQARRMTARVLGGSMVADAEVLFEELPRYHLRTKLSGADLKEYARDLLPGRQEAFSGKLSGMVDLHGIGAGTHRLHGGGWAALRGANLYETPLAISLLSILSLKTPDRTAFTAGDYQFRIDGPYVYFNRLDLRGDAISLRGRGSLGFDRSIDLTFYTIVGRDEYRLPFVDRILGEASQSLLQIKVDGSLDDPQTHRALVPALSGPLQQLWKELQNPQGTRGSVRPGVSNSRSSMFFRQRPPTPAG